MDVVLIPHINRQEVYAGHDLSKWSSYYEGKDYPSSAANLSPVNFFMPNYEGKYPLF